MATIDIEDLRVGKEDIAGNVIICIYAKKPPAYAVYRDPMKVAVHLAKDPAVESIQRAALAALNPLRGQISGLIDGWRSSADELAALDAEQASGSRWQRFKAALKRSRLQRNKARAARFDRRVADAMIMGLEGSVADALALLTEIRDDIIAERKGFAQTDYLRTAAIVMVTFLVAIGVISSPGIFRHPPAAWNIIWTGAAAGVVGAFFSIATGLRGRTVLIDLQKWDNRRDAILRITVGTMGAGIFLCLLLTGFVTLADFKAAEHLKVATDNDPVLWAIVLGFVAGFSERAVPDLLSKASFVTTEKDHDVAAQQAKVAGAAAAAIPAQAAAAADRAAAQVALVPADDETCPCDSPPGAGDMLTHDEDLPIAVGGVSTEPPDIPAAPAAVAEILAATAAPTGVEEPSLPSPNRAKPRTAPAETE
jgi:hypothetical protein